MKIETCCACDSATGRAGVADDSLYTDDGNGPFCEMCWKAIEYIQSRAAISRHRETVAPVMQAGVPAGWLQSGALLYRLTDERRPQNCDEIRVTMANGDHFGEGCTKMASEILALLSAAPVAPFVYGGDPAEPRDDSDRFEDVAQSLQATVPEGWDISHGMTMDSVVIQAPGHAGFVAVRTSMDASNRLLFALADALLSASVAPVSAVQDEEGEAELFAQQMFEQFHHDKKPVRCNDCLPNICWQDQMVDKFWRMWKRARAIQSAPVSAQDNEHPYTYASTQATNCAVCSKYKHTPLRVDSMGGYVCLTCIDNRLESLLDDEQARAAQSAPVSAQEPVALRPTDDALWDRTMKERDDYHEMADDLAAQIAAITGVDIGEHSSANEPWHNAMLAADDFIAKQIRDLLTAPSTPQAAPRNTEFDRLAGRGMHELRKDELSRYLSSVAINCGPSSDEFFVAADWIVSELERKTNDEMIIAVQLAKLREAPQAVAAPDRLDLTAVITWIENGCDPQEAAKELRIYQRKIEATAPQPIAAPACFMCHGTGKHAMAIALPAGVEPPPVQMVECQQCKPIAAPACRQLGAAADFNLPLADNKPAASQQPLPAQSIEADSGFQELLTQFYQTAYSFAGSTPHPISKANLIAHIDAWAARLSQPRAALSPGLQQNAELVLRRLEQLHKDMVPGSYRTLVEEAMTCALAVHRAVGAA